MTTTTTLQDLYSTLKYGTAVEKDSLYDRLATMSAEQLAPFIKTTDAFGWTALFYVVRFCHDNEDLRFVRLLVENGGSNHNVRATDGSTIWMLAAAQDNTNNNIFRYLLQELDFNDDIINTQNNRGDSALHTGVENSSAVVELLLKHGANPNIKNRLGYTPLQNAAVKGDTESAKLLVEYGAKIFGDTSNTRDNVMHIAALHDHGPFVQWLFDIGAQKLMMAENVHGKVPLVEAIERRKQCAINVLLHGYKDRVVSQKGDFSLHCLLRALACQGINIVLPIGTVPLEHMLALLTLFVSDQSHLICTLDRRGDRPLHIACRNRYTPLAVIHFLVEQDPTTLRWPDRHGNLPIHTLCASQPLLSTVQYLYSRHEAMMTNHPCKSPGLVAASTRASLDVIWYLMRANPSAALACLRRPSGCATTSAMQSAC